MIAPFSSQAWIGRPYRCWLMSSAVLYQPLIASSSASLLRQKMRARELPVEPAMARPRRAP